MSQRKLRTILFRDRLRAIRHGLVGEPLRSSLYKIPEMEFDETKQVGIAFTAIIKNEADYLEEWIAFHAMLGVRHFYLYDNGSTDDTAGVLSPYIEKGIVTLIPWKNFIASINPQRAAVAHAVANFGPHYRWLAPIDVDEFVFPVEGDSLDDTLAEFTDVPIICLPWINFGPSGHERKPEGLVIENYTERAAFPPIPEQYSLLRYKCFVDPKEVQVAGTHSFKLKGRGAIMINDRKEIFRDHQKRDPKYASADKLRLHHYFTRSLEELREKIAKGRVSRWGKIDPHALDRRLNQYALRRKHDYSILRFTPPLYER